jgi:release factor glutamine methyltransferase
MMFNKLARVKILTPWPSLHSIARGDKAATFIRVQQLMCIKPALQREDNYPFLTMKVVQDMTETIREALQAAKKRIQPASDSAALDAQVLLGAVLGVDRAYLLAHPEHMLTAEQAARYEVWVARCAAGEPLAYILGRRAFYDRAFAVSPAVLIPRPETELLLERALIFVQSKLTLSAVDAGTGSGALAVTLAAHFPQAVVYATDISPAALDIARRNAGTYAVQVQFFEGDLLTPLMERGLMVDLIMANLPYIASDDVPTLAVSRYEPLLALDGGADGLDLVRRLLEQAPAVWKPDGLMLLEIGAGQGQTAGELARQAFSKADVALVKDYAGLDRIISIAGK